MLYIKYSECKYIILQPTVPDFTCIPMFRLFGGYNIFIGNSFEEAIVDFTGGVAEMICIRSEEQQNQNKKKLHGLLKCIIDSKALMTASICVSVHRQH